MITDASMLVESFVGSHVQSAGVMNRMSYVMLQASSGSHISPTF